MLVRKILSSIWVKLPFVESQKDSMVKSIPIPTVINDFSIYKKLNIDGYPLPSDVNCKVTGWEVSNKGKITDYYGTDVDIETAVIVFQPDRNEVNRTIVEGRKSFMSGFSKIGTGQVPTVWNVDEGAIKNRSWFAWIRFHPVDDSGGFILNENGKMVDSILEIKIFNPYSYSMKESYPKDVLMLYQELLRRTDYFRKNIGFNMGGF